MTTEARTSVPDEAATAARDLIAALESLLQCTEVLRETQFFYFAGECSPETMDKVILDARAASEKVVAAREVYCRAHGSEVLSEGDRLRFSFYRWLTERGTLTDYPDGALA